MSGGSGRAVCGLLKGRGREKVVGERAVVGVSTAGDVGEMLGKRRGLTGGVREAEREEALARKETAPTSRPHRVAREREGERAHGLALTGGTPLSGTEGTRARACAQSWA
jgi:hypothetical protein